MIDPKKKKKKPLTSVLTDWLSKHSFSILIISLISQIGFEIALTFPIFDFPFVVALQLLRGFGHSLNVDAMWKLFKQKLLIDHKNDLVTQAGIISSMYVPFVSYDEDSRIRG